MKTITTHGAIKSNYDLKVRALASQWNTSDASLETIKSNLIEDFLKIPRANIGTVANNYSVKILNQFEPNERLEIWNEVIPGKERKVVTIINNTATERIVMG